MSRPLVEVRDLAKVFDVSPPWLNRVIERKPRAFVHAVDGVSFTIQRGRTLALVGESGCGKSTVARLLVGLYGATRGSVSVDGEDIAKTLAGPGALPLRRRMQMIFQDPYASLNPRWQVLDIVAEPLREHGLVKTDAEARQRVGELLSSVGLNPADAQKFPHQFSGGQRQRISIARALATQPEFLVCDEPTSALAKSKNMVSIRVLHSVGVKYAQEWITRFGFEAEKHPAYLTMALGAGSVTPMQMAQGYAVFANGGYRVNPQLIARITDNKGRLLYEAQPVTLADSARAIEPRNAFLMSSLLQEVTRSGTAARAQATLKRPDIYGKTGTTNDSMDAWFAGYQKDLVAIVWIGYDQPRKLGDRETGGGLSLPVWIEYMLVALKNKPVDEITPPEGVINVNGEWFYEEYTAGNGVKELAAEPNAPPAATDDEKKSILDLFKR